MSLSITVRIGPSWLVPRGTNALGFGLVIHGELNCDLAALTCRSLGLSLLVVDTDRATLSAGLVRILSVTPSWRAA